MLSVLVLAGAIAAPASAAIRITEWCYSGNDGEFIEFTNMGPGPVDMTGWSFDDDSRAPGSTDLSAFGIVAPNQSVILTEILANDFRANWSLPLGIKIIGSNANNLARNDEINIYDASSSLVDRLTFGDQNFPGTIRTQNKSGWNIPVGAGPWGNVNSTWKLSAVGDAQNSTAGAHGDIASPGRFVPSPGTLTLAGLAGLVARRRR